jgi:hypothetical protein
VTSPYQQQYLPPPPQRPPSTHPVDIVLSVLGVVGLLCVCGFLLLFSPFAVFVGLACAQDGTGPAVCSEAGAVTFVITLVVAGVLLVGASVGTLVAVILACVRGRPAWPWVLGGYLVTALAIGIFVAVTAGLLA